MWVDISKGENRFKVPYQSYMDLFKAQGFTLADIKPTNEETQKEQKGNDETRKKRSARNKG